MQLFLVTKKSINMCVFIASRARVNFLIGVLISRDAIGAKIVHWLAAVCKVVFSLFLVFDVSFPRQDHYFIGILVLLGNFLAVILSFLSHISNTEQFGIITQLRCVHLY